MKLIATAIMLVCLAFSAQADQRELPEFLLNEEFPRFEHKCGSHCSRSAKYSYLDNRLQSVSEYRTYDVIRYDLYLDWLEPLSKTEVDSADRVYYGINKITLQLGESNVIRLDAAYSLQIDEVFLNSLPAPLPTALNNEIEFDIPSEFTSGDTIVLELHYTYIGTNNRGFHLYPKGLYVGNGPAPDYDSVFVEERLAYTMSQPEDARYWMPCKDSPDDKALAGISVRVPNGFTVATNGLLDSVYIVRANNSVTYYWSDDVPIATYLMSASASIFAEYSDWYEKITSPGDSIEVKYYVWECDLRDTTGKTYAYNAEKAFKPTVNMLKYYSSIFGEYPFSKYGMVALQPFYFGGMEHQTMSAVNRVWLRGNAETGIAHEIVHQWLGDLVTCATWSDIWINEGAATWAEALWLQQIVGEPWYWAKMNSTRRNYLQSRQGSLKYQPLHSVTAGNIFTQYTALVYDKASWVYHMLRTMLGDETYYPSLRYLLDRNAFKSITSAEFQETFEEAVPNPPIPFSTYFDQWIFKAGHPVYRINTAVTKGTEKNYSLNVEIRQLQTGDKIPSEFSMPLVILSHKDGAVWQIDTVINTKRQQSYVIDCDFIPDSVTIDDRLVLCEIDENSGIIITSVESTDSETAYSISPNPVIAGELANLSFSLDVALRIEAALYDVSGRFVQNIFSGELPTGAYRINVRTSELSAGIYFVRMTAGSSVKFIKICVAK